MAPSADRSTNIPHPFALNSNPRRLAAHVLLALSNALFLGFIGLLSFCNRLSTDDFSALSTAKKYRGLWGALGWWWHHWTGRMVSMSVMIEVSQAAARDGKLLVYSLLTITAWIAAVYALLLRLLPLPSAANSSKAERLNLAVFIAGLAVFASFDRGEVWFWLSGSSTYLWPLTLLLFGLVLLLSEPPKRWQIVLATFFFALAGGCNEISGLLPLAVCGGMFLHKSLTLRRSGTIKRDWASLQRWLWPFLGSLAAVVMVVSAPGNHLRMALMPPLPVGAALLRCPAIVLQVVSFALMHRFPWFLMALASGLLAGNTFRASGGVWSERQTRTFLLRGTLALALALYLSLLPSTFALGTVPPLRAEFQEIVLLLGYCGLLGFLCAQQKIKKPVLLAVQVCVGASLLASSILTVGFVRAQRPVVRAYARAFDARYQEALRRKEEGRREEMITQQLPRSSDRWLNTNDLVQDPHSWINQNFASALELPFEIRILP